MASVPILLLLVAAGLTGCRPEAPAAAGGERGATVVIATSTDIDGINELTASQTQFSRDLLGRMFLHLFAEQPVSADRPATFLPELATSSELSDDRLTLTVKLRSDIVWSDGEPVTAEDVRWTWQAQTSPEVAWVYSHSKESISDVEIIDLHTVRFHFTHPSPAPIAAVNEGFILPRHAWQALPFAEWRLDGDWFTRHLVVDGPFRLAEWIPQQEISLVRNERYSADDPPQIERLVLRVIPDQTSQLAQLLAGEIDFVISVPPDSAGRVESAPDIELLTYWPLKFTYICWNTGDSRFNSSEVRRALTFAIDRRSLVETLWHGRARVSTSPIVSSVWARDESLEPWPYDPQAAAELLDRAGWRDTDGDGTRDRDGQPLRFELLSPTSSAIRSDAAVMIQSQLARIGVTVDLRQLESNTLTSRAIAHDFDAFIGSWNIDTSMDIGYAFHSDSIANGFNFGLYANPEVDRLIDRFRQLDDPAAQRPVLAELQQRIHADQPYTFLWEPQSLIAVHRRLQDVRPNYLSVFFHLRDWRLAD